MLIGAQIPLSMLRQLESRGFGSSVNIILFHISCILIIINIMAKVHERYTIHNDNYKVSEGINSKLFF